MVEQLTCNISYYLEFNCMIFRTYISHFLRNFIKYIYLGFIPKVIELFLISSLILCFTIDIDASNSFSRLLCKFSYFKISFLSFKRMKILHLFKVLHSVYLYSLELSFFFFLGKKLKLFFFCL